MVNGADQAKVFEKNTSNDEKKDSSQALIEDVNKNVKNLKGKEKREFIEQYGKQLEFDGVLPHISDSWLQKNATGGDKKIDKNGDGFVDKKELEKASSDSSRSEAERMMLKNLAGRYDSLKDLKEEMCPADGNKGISKSDLDARVSQNKEEQLPIGTRSGKIEIQKGDQTETLLLDENGKPKQYTDAMGETYVRRAEGWYRYSLVSPDGDRLENFHVDHQGNVDITYKIQKNDAKAEDGYDFVKRQVLADGSEITMYDTDSNNEPDFDKPNSVTKTTREGDAKVIEVMNGDQPVQTVKFKVVDEDEPPQLVYFEDPDKNVYVREGKAWTKNGAAWDGKVTAESDGGALVLNGKPDKTSQRFLPDGTRVDAVDKDHRTVKLTDGTTIKNDISSDGTAVMTTTKPNGSVIQVKFNRCGQSYEVAYSQDGQTSVFTKGADGQWLSSEKQPVSIEDKTKLAAPNGEVVYLDADGTPEKFTSAGANVIEHRTFVPEVPENYEKLLQARLTQSKEDPGYLSLYSKTKDGGSWDDKQSGGQYQTWGNVAWGMYAEEMGFDHEDANKWVGWYKYLNSKSNPEWKDTYGQNPADYKLTKAGYELRQRQKRSNSQVATSPEGVRLPSVPIVVSYRDPFVFTPIY